MPQKKKAAVTTTATTKTPAIKEENKNDSNDLFNDPEYPASSGNEDDEHTSPKPAGKKRPRAAEDEDEEVDLPSVNMDFRGEMQKMLECFGSDITKTLGAKKKRLEQFTHSSIKNTNRKVEDIWKAQNVERVKLRDEFNKQIKNVFSQWEADLGKAKEQEDKLQLLFQQQQKLFQQTRVVQTQRLKSIKSLHEQFTKGMLDLERCHSDQQGNVQAELKKEMALLQKKILMDTQHQEMANVRKSLQTMLF